MAVSVIIPTFNRYELLFCALRSVEAQTYQNIECIIVDDCSSDKRYQNLSQDAEKVLTKPFKVIRLSQHSTLTFGCPTPQRDVGIKNSNPQTEYFAFLDDDDVWMPEKLTKQIQAMNEERAEMSCSDALTFAGRRYLADVHFNTVRAIFQRAGSGENFSFPTKWSREFIAIHNSIICSSVVLRKSLVEQVGDFKKISFGEDYEYWVRCLQKTPFCVFLPEPLLFYRTR